MNCYQECKPFFATKSQTDLGDPARLGSCANCLYWQNGPGRAEFQYADCPCNLPLVTETRGGRDFSVDTYNTVTDCLKHASGSKCGVMLSNFTNTETAYSPPDSPFEAACSRKRNAYQGLWYPGVF